MAKRKQARPSRPSGSAAPTNHKVSGEHVENEEEGELAAVREDAEETSGVLNDVKHGARRNTRKSGRFKNTLGHEGSADETAIEEVTVEVPFPESGDRGVAFAEITLRHPLVVVNDQGKGKGEQIQEVGISRTPFRVVFKVPAGKKHGVVGYQYLSAEDVTVEVLSYSEDDSARLHLSGKIDGSDYAVSGLVYLIKQAIIYLEAMPYEGNLACKFVIFISKKAFDLCALYLGNSDRKPLGKAIQSVVEWLRPELSAESISTYGLVGSQIHISDMLAIAGEKHDRQVEALHNSEEKQHNSFDPTALYEAVMPSRTQPELDMDFPELVPELRSYQRRAAYWMVQREKGPTAIDKKFDDSGSASTSGVKTTKSVEHPLWVPVDSLDGQSRFFYNPYSGYVSMDPHDFQTYVHGGILADEMGLGKTVELLACILAHRASKESVLKTMDSANRARERLMKYKRDRVECSCGATQEDDFYKGSWVQCDHCDAWQHALCVGYASPVDIDANLRRIAAQALQVKKDEKVRLGKRVREVHAMPVNIVTMEKPGKKSKNVYARVPRGNIKSSVDKDDEETFVCGTCAEMIGQVEIEGECGATLVVCPAPILRQWQDEISRHVTAGTLRVLVYEGVQKGATVVSGSIENSKMEKIKVVGAHDLATSDLVLTTYDTLRADVSHVATSTHRIERSFRQPKRYPVTPTPLTRLKWWRLCLDEAQMVESVTSRATEMAMTLRATHRWCVTGTPIQRGLDDLYGLLRFLGAEPFDNKRWWTSVLKEPYEEGKYGAVRAMHDLFQGLMWRSTKAQVADELGLPPQDERLEWLRFSPIEAHFYRQQHERCAVRAREVIANYRKYVSSTRSSSGRRPGARNELDTNASAEILTPVTITSGVGSTLNGTTNLQHVQNGDLGIKAPPDELEDRLLSNKEAEKLLDQLRWLRQACVHPQVGSAGIRSLQRSPMTMDEILEVLVDKAKLEAEDAQRSLFGALNGLAGLALIENDVLLAVSIYREVLSYTEENAQDVRVDPLQKLHTLHNLAEVLKVKSRTGGDDDEGHATVCNAGRLEAGDNVNRPDVPRTLRDGLLLKQCEEIKAKYLATFYAKLAAVQADFQSASKQVQEAKLDLSDGGSAWWMEVLCSLEQQPDLGKDIIKKIRDQLLENDHLGEAGNMGRVKHNNLSSIALRFQDISGLKMVLVMELEAMEEGRKELLQRLLDLGAKMENPDMFDAERAGNCSRCQPDMKGPSCAHCEAEELFQAYENRLFFLKVTGAGDVAVSAEDALIAQHASLALKRRATSSAGLGNKEAPVEVLERRARNRDRTSAQVTRAPSGTERILTILRGQVHLALGRDKLPAARRHLQLLEAMRKEFAQAKVLALAQREVLFEVHELNMATTRLRLRFPGEKIPNISVLHPEQVPQQNVHLTAEKFAALDELKRLKGQLRYLNGVKSARQKVEPGEPGGNIASSDSSIASKQVESSEEECPICHELLGSRFMVLPCGHVLCCKCMLNLVERSTLPQSQKKINCPSCRRRTNASEVAYVVNAYEKEGLDPAIAELQGGEKEDVDFASSVKGSYGTKLEAVLRRILRLKSEDPEMKVLLFSEWQGVLDVVEHALTTNHITYARVKNPGQMNAAIDRFRGVEETIGSKKRGRKKAKVDEVQGPVQVLLMPVKHGANGLNLVEAQHVMLLEPLLNPSMEAQAINRVHRIGQTRATFVHRFIVHDTVEESIYGLRRQKAVNLPGAATGKPDVYNLTLKDLSSLFAIQTGGASNSVQVQPSPPVGTLESLTPARAAAAAAESRLMSSREP